MADKKFLMEQNLLESYKKFMHLVNETTYFSGNLDEEGEEDPNAQGGAPDPNQQPPMDGGGDPNAAGGDAMGQDPNAQGGDMGMGGDDAAFDPNQQPPMDGGGDPNAAGGDMGGMPPMDDPMMGGEEETQEEDEVIDVDDITNAQEKVNTKVNKVGRNLGKVDDKIVALMQAIKSLQTMVDDNNAKIESFKTEFEKRNPTPTEKMNLRSLDSYPFNDNPKDYWEKKATQPEVSGNRYEAYADNKEPVAKKEYVITQDDVNDYTQSNIKDSFHIDDDLRSTIEKIFEL